MNKLSLSARAVVASVVAAGSVVVPLLPAGSAAAQSGADLRVNGQSEITLTGNGPWTVNVSGTNFQVPAVPTARGGGVYVLFGAINGTTWGPSHRGKPGGAGLFGFGYSYSGVDSSQMTDDESGASRFVGFYDRAPDDAATKFFMNVSGGSGYTKLGSFAAGRSGQPLTMTIQSPTYSFVNPMNGQSVEVDCRVAECGIYTIGAHGQAEGANERFVRVKFAAAQGGSGATTGGAPATGGSNGQAGTGPSTGGQNGGAATQGTTSQTNGTRPGSTSANATPTTLSPQQAEALKKALLEAKAKQDAEAAAAAAAGTTVESTAPVETDVAVAAETSIADDAAVAADDDIDETTTTKKATEVAKASETVTVTEDDGGSAGLLWGSAIGIPVLAAGGVLVWRKKAAQA